VQTNGTIVYNELLVDHVDVWRYFNNLSLSQQAVERQGVDLRSAFNEMCRSIHVGA
jgi:hypothetical protein